MTADAPALPLAGRTVAVTADRKGPELETSLRRLGADVVRGSTMRAVPPEVDDRLTAETDAVLAARPDWLAVSTGSGLRAWLAAAHRADRGGAVEALLRSTRVVARGAKSHGALRAVGVEPVFVSKVETMDDVAAHLLEHVEPDASVAVQVHGGEVIGSLDALRRHVRALHTVAPYRWVLPADLAAAETVVERIVAGEVDVLVQTSAPSARNLFAVADGLGRRDDLVARLRSDTVCVATVGPVTARAFDEVGVPVDVVPERGRTADLLRALSQWATTAAV